ncbi:MAG: hypothetical protein HKN21_05030, partial [Candidatus Eisenbacteria bacterium]|nr:hypothetical protein [Candidatus Eisenbacteria bacterium]
MIEGLLLLLVAFWVAVDTTAWGQLLVSEPIFTGLLAGAILGEVWTGMVVGALFQVLWSSRAPLGGVLFPWAGPATLGAVVVAVWASPQTALGFSAPEILPLTGALAAGMGGGEMGRRVLGWLRGRRDHRWAKLAADPGRNLKRVRRLHLQEVIGEGLLG